MFCFEKCVCGTVRGSLHRRVSFFACRFVRAQQYYCNTNSLTAVKSRILVDCYHTAHSPQHLLAELL